MLNCVSLTLGTPGNSINYRPVPQHRQRQETYGSAAAQNGSRPRVGTLAASIAARGASQK